MSDGFLSPEDRRVCAKESVCSMSTAERWRRQNLRTCYLFSSPLFIYRRVTRCLILRGGPCCERRCGEAAISRSADWLLLRTKADLGATNSKKAETDVNKMTKDNQPRCLLSLKSHFFCLLKVKGFLFVISCTSAQNETVLPLQAVHRSKSLNRIKQVHIKHLSSDRSP